MPEKAALSKLSRLFNEFLLVNEVSFHKIVNEITLLDKATPLASWAVEVTLILKDELDSH